MSGADLDRAAGYRAVAALYHAYLTGLILSVVSRRGGADAAELVYRTFRRQHLEKFLPGLVKLGLDRLPHAVACAQYHYLSNHLGGVRVEYMYESDRKAWVRYLPPRWILPESVFDAWSALWEGVASVHDRHLRVTVTRRIDWGDPWIEWRIRDCRGRATG